MATPLKQSRKRRNDVPIEKKIEGIGRVEKGESARAFAHEYNVDHSAVSKWVKQKATILAQYEQNCSRDGYRAPRAMENTVVNALTYEWFRLCRSKQIPLSGSFLSVVDTSQ